MRIRVLRTMDENIAADIVKDCALGIGVYEICIKYDITEDQFYRITRKYKGIYVDAQRRDSYQKKLAKVEKKLKEKEEEIKLLRAALKKY